MNSTCHYIAIAMLLCLATGCASTPLEPLPLPQPSEFSIRGTVDLNLPPLLAAGTGVPGTAKLTLDAKAHSEAISVSPLQSHHAGHLSLVAVDTSNGRELVNIDLNVDGVSAGSPDSGLSESLRRFMDAASLIARPLPQLGKSSDVTAPR